SPCGRTARGGLPFARAGADAGRRGARATTATAAASTCAGGRLRFDRCPLRRRGLDRPRRLDAELGECLRIGLLERVFPLASGLAEIGETELREVIELLPFDLRALPFARHGSRLRLPLRSAPAPAA